MSLLPLPIARLQSLTRAPGRPHRAAAFLLVCIAATAAAQPSYTAPATAVGATSSAQTATLTLTASGTLGSITVLTQGALGLDFNLSPGSTCIAGTPYTAGQSCSVAYTFSPTAPGRRLGGIILYDNSATPVLLATAFLNGIGEAPIASITPGNVTYPITGLNNPQGITLDPSGNIYVAGGSSNTVLKYSPQGALLGTIGSGFDYPTSVAIDGLGNIYIADEEDHRIILIPINGGAQTIFADNLGYPYPLIVDGAGNLYTGYIANGPTTAALIQITPAGVVNTLATEVLPSGLALDASGNIFLSDYISGTVMRVPAGGGTAVQVNTGNVALTNPYGVAIDPSGNLYIGDYSGLNTGQILELPSTGGTPVTILNTAAQSNCLALAATGSLLFCDKPANSIGLLNRTSTALIFPTTPLGDSSPQQVVTLENDGNLPLTLAAPTITGEFNFSGAATTCAAGTLGPESACTLGIVFTAAAEGPATGTATLTDNTLNTSSTTQTVALSAIGGPKAITFPQPVTPVLVNTSAMLTATVSNGDPVTYSIVSGTATLSGSQITYTTVGAVTIEADSAAQGSASAANPVQRTVQVQTQTTITWNPASNSAYAGIPLGSAILDATATAQGTFAYTATNAANVTTAITPSSGLPPGAYTLTASFTPSSPNDSTASATIPFTSIHQELFIANFTGSVSSFLDGGEPYSSPTTGGGIGAAVDANGFVWSINTSGASVTQFTDAGAVYATSSNGGINSASALAIDGLGTIWIANVSNISALTSSGAAFYSTPVAQAGNISSPASISIDTAGSLWIANPGNNTVTEIVGAAAPVATPTVTQVIQSSPATRP